MDLMRNLSNTQQTNNAANRFENDPLSLQTSIMDRRHLDTEVSPQIVSERMISEPYGQANDYNANAQVDEKTPFRNRKSLLGDEYIELV